MYTRIKLKTDNLWIRTYQIEDAPDLNQFVWENTYYLYETAPMTLRNNLSIASSKEFLEMLDQQRIAGKWIWNAIFKKESRRFIGQISIYNLEEMARTCELGYFITADQMGKGYATEALHAISQYCFQKLRRSSILLRIKPDNIASKQVAKKVGYQQIGLQSKTFRTYHGNLIDQEVYELRRQLWQLYHLPRG